MWLNLKAVYMLNASAATCFKLKLGARETVRGMQIKWRCEQMNKYAYSVEHFLWDFILLLQSCIKYGVNFKNILYFIVCKKNLPKIQGQFSSRKFLLCSSTSASETKYFLRKNAVTDFEEDFSSNVKFTFAALSCTRKIWYQNIKIHFNTEICLENFKHLEGSAIQHDWPAKLIRDHKNLKHTPHICHNNYNCSLCKKFSQV